MATKEPKNQPDGEKRYARASSYDVAHAAGVAQSTVSRCFKEDSNISESTRARVLKIAAELGYTPNSLARSLITQRSNMVGVICSEFTLCNNPELVNAISSALKQANISMLLMIVENESAIETTLPEALAYPLDGLISCVFMDEEQIQLFVKRRVPIVFFNRNIRSKGTDCILTDQAEGSAQMASRLHAAGHRRILCVGGPIDAPEDSVSRARLKGFIEAIDKLGGVDITCIHAGYTYENGRDQFLSYFADSALPEAIFCVNDQLALGVMDACRYTCNLSIPDAVSVAGFDNVSDAGRPVYNLTTIHQQIVPMATRAVDLILRRIAQPELPEETVTIRGILIARTSA
ncbi:LacI family DNA-binding transcriptional regulator [Enterobacteriaceae bacterium H4N4]|uniref:LacI family DNA-binding transcriptional regulator n=1 Tax=Silvania confinis TaxID=2926470 RepID=A0A9J6QL24_9ENTR|nr:LacI family DNA-binding transcriptional regulator [Silvania confinis]MCU6671564.1 LacI family DNA-binding transcriptional regulator [Silvania confinis]